MRKSLTISFALFLLCCLSISWAQPQEPTVTDPPKSPKVKKPIPRHDELRAKPDLADDWDLIRVRRDPQKPVVEAPSSVNVDDLLVQEAAKFAVAQKNYMKGPIRVFSATLEATGMYTIQFQAKYTQVPDKIPVCEVEVMHLPEQRPKFQLTQMYCAQGRMQLSL